MAQRHVGSTFLALLFFRTELYAEESNYDIDSLGENLKVISLVTHLKDESIKGNAILKSGSIINGAEYISEISKGGDDAAKANIKLGVNLVVAAGTGGLSIPAQMAVGAVVDLAVDHLYDSYVVSPRRIAEWNAMIDNLDATKQAEAKAHLNQFERENAEFLSRLPRDPDVGKISPPVFGSGSFSAIDTDGVSAGRARETLEQGIGEKCDDMAWYMGKCTKGDREPDPAPDLAPPQPVLYCGSQQADNSDNELSAANYACP